MKAEPIENYYLEISEQPIVRRQLRRSYHTSGISYKVIASLVGIWRLERFNDAYGAGGRYEKGIRY